MAIDYDLLKEIKQRADIVDVISSFLSSVQKKGRNYVAICPFHDDTHPSMQISKEKQSFRCFVCGTGGDVFTFVQKYEKCSFEEAVRKVCDIIGFDDPRLHSKVYERPVDENLVPIYKCISDLQKFYEYGLTTEEGKIAREYLDNRRLSEDQRVKFSLGYSLSDGKLTISYLQKKGYSLKNIEDTGICLASTSNMTDHNAGRLIFPIKDSNGQVVGFSARRMINDDSPKYVNTTETKIFTKGNILYNYHIAKQTARHDGYVYVVEGFMDVFALDSIGITSCVALMSTKLTDYHIGLLRRLNCEIRLCLDGDKAGQEAMMRIITQLADAGLRFRLVSVPGELRDPDEILKQDGEEKLKSYVSTLVDSFSFAINYYKNISPLASSEDREKVVRHFAPYISLIKSKLEQDDYIYKLAEITNFSPNAVREFVKNNKVVKNDSDNRTLVDRAKVNTEIPKELFKISKAENLILLQMLESTEAIQFYETSIQNFIIPLYEIIANAIQENISNGGEASISSLISFLGASNITGKQEALDFITNVMFSNQNTSFNQKILNDCRDVLIVEKNKIYERSTFLSASKGKTPQEKARLLNDYVMRTQNKGK